MKGSNNKRERGWSDRESERQVKIRASVNK